MPMLLEVFSEEDSYEDKEANDNHITTVPRSVYGFRIAVDRFVRDLKISFYYDHGLVSLPSRLFRCETLETLELNRVILLDVPSQFTFCSLVKLRLLSVIYSDDESFSSLISNCPVLEELAVETCPQDNVVTFTVDLPSLKSLSVGNTVRENPPNDHLFVIHSHSLKRLSIVDYFGELDLIGNLPKLVEANLQSMSYHANVLESFTFVKRFYVCLADKARYPHGTVLFQLVCLELCSCDDSWTSMLVSLLHHSPKLQALKLVQDHGMPAERKVRWIQPRHVPECLLLHLKRFEWRDYEGTKVKKEVAIYILNNAKRLVSATIYPFSVSLVRKRKMFEEVEIATRSLRAFKLVRKHQIFEEFEILQPEGQKHMGAYNEKLIVQES
uniref:FBD domain-containing protein n=1 Tax=Brassica oleracea TaxID=3712 RepID=A0A3P6EBA3_BRAOL|nr:unnamed protein product [Brassica oleracea]